MADDETPAPAEDSEEAPAEEDTSAKEVDLAEIKGLLEQIMERLVTGAKADSIAEEEVAKPPTSDETPEDPDAGIRDALKSQLTAHADSLTIDEVLAQLLELRQGKKKGIPAKPKADSAEEPTPNAKKPGGKRPPFW